MALAQAVPGVERVGNFHRVTMCEVKSIVILCYSMAHADDG